MNQEPFYPTAPQKTDVTNVEQVQAGKNPLYQPKDYLAGRIVLPPWFYSKPTRFFTYGDSLSVTNNTSGRLDVTLDADSYFLVEAVNIVTNLSLTQLCNYASDIQIVDSTYGQAWSNAPVPLKDISGVGSKPKKLHYPNLLRPSATLSFMITNNWSSTQTYYCSFVGRRVYNMTEQEAAFLSQRSFYQYVMSIPAISAGVLGTKTTIQLLGNQDFILKKIFSSELLENQADANSDAGTDVTGQIRDATNDYYLFNKKLHTRLWTGSMQTRVSTQKPAADTYQNYSFSDGFALPKALYLRANAILEGDWDNVGSNNLAASRVTFEGFKIYQGSVDATLV